MELINKTELWAVIAFEHDDLSPSVTLPSQVKYKIRCVHNISPKSSESSVCVLLTEWKVTGRTARNSSATSSTVPDHGVIQDGT